MGNLTAVIAADTSQFNRAVYEARQVLDQYTRAAKYSSKEIKDSIGVTESQVNAFNRVVTALSKVNSGTLTTAQQQKVLKTQIAELRAQWADLSNEARRSDFGQAVSNSLGSAEEKMKQISEQVRSFGSVGSSVASLKSQLRQATNELVGLTAQYRALSQAEKESAGGRELAAKMSEVRARAGELKDTIGDVSQEITVMASDTPNLDAFNQVMGIGADLMTTYAGIIGKVTGDEDALKNMIATVTMVQGAANTLTKVSNALQSSSAVMLKVRAVQEKAAATAIAIKTAAEKGSVVTTKAATIAQAAFNAVAKANPYLLLASAIATVGGALYAFSKKCMDAKDEAKKLKDEVKDLKQELSTMANDIDDGEFAPGDAMRIAQISKEIEKLQKEREGLYKMLADGIKEHDGISVEVDIDYINRKISKLKNQKKTIQDLYNKEYTPEKKKDKPQKTAKDEVKPIANSIADLESKLNAEQEKLNKKLVAGTDEWRKQKDLVDKMTFSLDRMKKGITNIKPDIDVMKLPTQSVVMPIKIKIDEKDTKLSTKTIAKINATLNDQLLEQGKLRTEALNDAISNLGSAFSSLGKIIGGTGGEMVGWAAQSATAVAQMLAQNASLIASCHAASIAGASKSAFQLPFPYNLAAFASMAATIVGIFASLPSFASGGIISGRSGIGDQNLARVNSGEMILNGTQQSRLFNILNRGGMVAAPANTNPVEFKIKGSTLVGAQKNYYKKNSRL